MTDRPESPGNEAADSAAVPDEDTLSPLPGESGIPNVVEQHRIATSTKGLLAVAMLIFTLVVASAFWIHRFTANGKTGEAADSKLVGDRPAAASAEPRRLEMPPPPLAVAATPHVPALVPAIEETEPIGVRRTGEGAPVGVPLKGPPPEDAPVLLVTTRPGVIGTSTGVPNSTVDASSPRSDARHELQVNGDDPIASTNRNLQAYQRQLQGLLDTLTQSTAAATAQPAGPLPSGALLGATPFGGPPAGGTTLAGTSSTGGSLFGGQLQGSSTPRVAASMLGNRSLTLPKGTAFTCALKTKVISAASGLVGCQVQRNVFSDDGRVLLIERGSHLDGEYRITSVRPGTVRIPVLWTRIRTPLGVTVEIESPGMGRLGESGVDGHVDNRWSERIGAAMLLSLIDDSVKLIIQNQANESRADTIVLPSSTANTSKLAEKVLDSTINIPPLIYQNQGGIVGIYVARDVDFSSVYELQPSDAPREPTRREPR